LVLQLGSEDGQAVEEEGEIELRLAGIRLGTIAELADDAEDVAQVALLLVGVERGVGAGIEEIEMEPESLNSWRKV
jgi:hypothetical protein